MTLDLSVAATAFSLRFLAEIGDKTQVVLVALAGSTGAPWSAFAGGRLALWSVSALAVLAGATVLQRVPRGWVHRGAAVLFGVFGGLALARAVPGPVSVWESVKKSATQARRNRGPDVFQDVSRRLCVPGVSSSRALSIPAPRAGQALARERPAPAALSLERRR